MHPVKAEDPAPKRTIAPKAVEEAYSRYRAELRQFFRRLSRRTELSDDLVQEVYLELLRYPPRDTLREPQAFLYKIAWNVVNRSNGREQRSETLADTARRAHENESALVSAHDVVSELDAEQRILKVLGQLPPLYGAALILWKRDGLAYSEIGRQLGISAHTVRKYLTRAMAHVKNVDWDEDTRP
jgi:RNA polymerase sigma-70 factor (ECF subfamily)